MWEKPGSNCCKPPIRAPEDKEEKEEVTVGLADAKETTVDAADAALLSELKEESRMALNDLLSEHEWTCFRFTPDGLSLVKHHGRQWQAFSLMSWTDQFVRWPSIFCFPFTNCFLGALYQMHRLNLLWQFQRWKYKTFLNSDRTVMCIIPFTYAASES